MMAEMRQLQNICEADDECEGSCLGVALKGIASALSSASVVIYDLVSGLDVARRLGPADAENGIDFYREVRGFQTELILHALRLAGGRQRAAAKLLGIKVTTLNCKIKTFEIDWRNAHSAHVG